MTNNFLKNESGATAIEYGLIAWLIAVAIVGVLVVAIGQRPLLKDDRYINSPESMPKVRLMRSGTTEVLCERWHNNVERCWFTGGTPCAIPDGRTDKYYHDCTEFPITEVEDPEHGKE